MKKSEQLVWNVYDYGIGERTFRVFNAFDHGSFLADVQKILKADLSKEEFTEKLRREVQYYYWAKCEWECVITDTHPHIGQRELDRILEIATASEPRMLRLAVVLMLICPMPKKLMFMIKSNLIGMSLSSMYGDLENREKAM